MFKASKSVQSFGAGVLALGVLMLAAPRAAHAIAATLVQVVNTTANPAITQDTSKQASQIVTLNCMPASNACIQVDGHGNFSPVRPYVVPAASNFVITSLDYLPNSGSGGGTLSIVDQSGANPQGFSYEAVGVADLSLPFTWQFSSGIVVAGTGQPAITSFAGFAANSIVTLHGYLTAN